MDVTSTLDTGRVDVGGTVGLSVGSARLNFVGGRVEVTKGTRALAGVPAEILTQEEDRSRNRRSNIFFAMFKDLQNPRCNSRRGQCPRRMHSPRPSR